MRRHLLRVLQRATIGEIGRDASGAEAVIADRRMDADGDSTTTDHAPRIGLAHWLLGQSCRRVPPRCSEHKALAVIGKRSAVAVGKLS